MKKLPKWVKKYPCSYIFMSLFGVIAGIGFGWHYFLFYLVGIAFGTIYGLSRKDEPLE